MSRIDTPMEREPVEIDGRSMTPARRARIIARDKRCRYPGCEETASLEVDHIVALALGGRDTDDNLECLCAAHHLAKTKRDVGLIAKAKRIHARHTGTAPKTKRPLKGRGFAKSRDWSGVEG